MNHLNLCLSTNVDADITVVGKQQLKLDIHLSVESCISGLRPI